MFQPESSASPATRLSPPTRFWRPFESAPLPASPAPSNVFNAAGALASVRPSHGNEGTHAPPSPPAPAPVIPSTWYIERIAAGDLALCELKGQCGHRLSSVQVEANARRAAEIIQDLEPLRSQLAQRTSAQLHRLLTRPEGLTGMDQAQLQTRIEHAGLLQVLRTLRLAELTPAQRMQLATALRNAGCHTRTVRNLLGLAEQPPRQPPAILDVETLESPAAAAGTPRRESALLNQLLPQARADELHQADTERRHAASALHRAEAALRTPTASPAERRARRALCASLRKTATELRTHHATRRGVAYQQAAMVSQRFGYPDAFPAWKFMARSSQRDPRVKMLAGLMGKMSMQLPGVQLP